MEIKKIYVGIGTIAVIVIIALAFIGAHSSVTNDSAIVFSPLFQQSLEGSIHDLETRGTQTDAVTGTLSINGRIDSLNSSRGLKGIVVILTKVNSLSKTGGNTATVVGGICMPTSAGSSTCSYTCAGSSTCSSTCGTSSTCLSTCAVTCSATCTGKSTCAGTTTCSSTCGTQSTCLNTCSGLYTCGTTCSSTCVGKSTCSSTCVGTSTCSSTCGTQATCIATCASTCQSTCAGKSTCIGTSTCSSTCGTQATCVATCASTCQSTCAGKSTCVGTSTCSSTCGTQATCTGSTYCGTSCPTVNASTCSGSNTCSGATICGTACPTVNQVTCYSTCSTQSCPSSPDIQYDTTDADGNYSFNNLDAGNYIITPKDSVFKMIPENRSVTLADSSANSINFSSTIKNTTPSGTNCPAAPRKLTAYTANAQATLQWNKNIETNILRYRLYRNTSQHPTTVIDSTSGPADTIRVYNGLSNGTTHYFRITAVDSAGNEGAFSNEISATPAVPSGPTIVLSDVSAPVGTVVLVPLMVTKFDNVGAISLSMIYNNAALTFTGISNTSGGPEFTASTPAPGVLNLIWYDASGSAPLSITSGKLVDLKFTCRGGTSSLIFNTQRCEMDNQSLSQMSGFTYQSGSITATAAIPPETSVETKNIPSGLLLGQNYPNPFNPSTQISYSIPQRAHVTLSVYDILGKEVASLVDGSKEAGTYTVTWNANPCPSGVYLYRLTAGSYTTTRKLLLLR